MVFLLIALHATLLRVLGDDRHRMHMYMSRFATARRNRDVPMTMRVISVRMRSRRVEPDIIICKLAHLRIVNPHDLLFLRHAQPQSRDEVQDPEDDGRHDKAVGHPASRIGELHCQLNVVVVEPASGDAGKAIEACNALLGEEPGEKVADDTANGVGCEDLIFESRSERSRSALRTWRTKEVCE